MARDDKQKGSAHTARELQEEAAFLRQKCNSLSMRGHYAECIKTIEDNLSLFYRGERWPENFFSILRLFQKCYPSLNKGQDIDEYLAPLLKRNGIPFVFAGMLKGSDSSIRWTADYFRDLANSSRGREDFESALAYADILLKIDPGSASAHLLKGWICEDMGRDTDAASLYEQALALNASNRFALNSLAKYHLKSSPKKALEYIEQAVADHPEEASYHATKADILKKTGDRAGAMEAIQKAIDNDPYNPDYPYEKGELLLADGKRGAAIAQYRIATALNERHVPSLLRLTEFSRDSQPDLALTYINTVVSLQPDNRGAMLTRAQLQQRLGENTAAMNQYKELLALDEGNSDALAGLGALYLVTGNAAKAIELLDKAVSLEPKSARRHYDKAKAHQKLGQDDEAVKEYRACVAADRGFSRAWAELGFLHEKTKPREAADYFSRAIELDPENAYYHTSKAELLAAAGDRAGAIESYNQACRYDRHNAELHYKLALLLAEAGNNASAVEHLRTSVGIAPTNPGAFYQLARLLLDTHPESALLYINSAIALRENDGACFFLKAKVLEALGRNGQAVEELRNSLGTGEKDPEVMKEMAALLGGGCPRVALLYLNRAVEAEPGNPAYLCARAHLLYRLGQKGKAQAQYEELLEKNPDQHEALFGMACILADRKEKKALEYFNRAIKLEPAAAEYHAGKAAFLAGDDAGYREAVEAYSAAIDLNKQAWQVILEKARLLDAHGEQAPAMEEYRRVLMVYRKCVEAAARLGVMLAEISPSTALIYLDQAVRLDPKNYLHYAWRGKVLFSLGREQAAADELRQAIACGGGNAEVYFTLAEMLSRRMPETALGYLRLALKMEPDKAEYLLLGGNLHFLLGEYEPAKDYFRRAAELDQKCHEAHERLAEIAYLEDDPGCDELAGRAHETKPECVACAYLKARILDERKNDTDSALNFMNRVVDLEPDNLVYREKLVELLRKKKAYLRLLVENRRLEKLRKQLEPELPLSVPEPPEFEVEENGEAAPSEAPANTVSTG